MDEYGLNSAHVARLIELALDEDVGAGDITSAATVLPDAVAVAEIRAKEAGVLAGLPIAARVFHSVDAHVEFVALAGDGQLVTPGEVVCRIQGRARSILTGERVALNFLQHLSGIATRTRSLVALVQGTNARLADTRKTVPGMRSLAKYAVRVGGGHNHRHGLYDAVLIKENHIAAAGGVAEAIRRARALAPHTTRVEIEAETLEQVRTALDAGADILLLDTMELDTLRQSVALCQGRALTEASGGVTEATLRDIAETGVDIISVGALTHSVKALDLSLRIVG